MQTYVYCGIRNALAHAHTHTTLRIRDNVLCVLRPCWGCACLRFHSLQFSSSSSFFLQDNPLSLCRCRIVFVRVLCLSSIWPTYVPFCLELQIACKMSVVHTVCLPLICKRQTQRSHTHTQMVCVCLCVNSFFISHNK